MQTKAEQPPLPFHSEPLFHVTRWPHSRQILTEDGEELVVVALDRGNRGVEDAEAR